MSKIMRLIVAGAVVFSVAACGSATKEKLGLSRKAPNEFLVMPRAPLSLPPEYDLRPVVENQSQTVDNDGLSEAERNLLEQVNKAQ